MLRVLPALALALLLVGCQRPEPTATPAGGTPAPAGQKLKVVYIPKNTGNPYFTEEIRGFEDACKELGCDFFTTAPSKADATSQIPFIKEQIQQKVDILAITPNDPAALNQVLDEARAKGILVVTVDADLVGNETHRDAAVLPTDFSKIGESQVELIGSQMNYEGDIAILSATRDAPNQNVWIEGMKQALDRNPNYAKMKLVETVYGDDEPQKSTTEFEALLSKHPGRLGVISPTSVGLAAAAQSLEIAMKSRTAPVILTGLSTPNQMKRFVETDVVKGFQLWSPYDMGYLACNMAVQMKGGKLKPAEGGTFDVAKLGKKEFGKNNVVNTGPLVTFDKSNIAKYNF